MQSSHGDNTEDRTILSFPNTVNYLDLAEQDSGIKLFLLYQDFLKLLEGKLNNKIKKCGLGIDFGADLN